MLNKRIAVTLIGTALFASSCSFSTDALWPSLSGSSPKEAEAVSQRIVIKPSREETAKQPLINPITSTLPPKLGATNFKVKAPQSARSTGTFVGKKITNLRNDLRRLQASIDKENSDLQNVRVKSNSNSKGYHDRVASMRSRLQLGTTPGNPILVSEWNAAYRRNEFFVK
jgi:hypothetical protein